MSSVAFLIFCRRSASRSALLRRTRSSTSVPSGNWAPSSNTTTLFLTVPFTRFMVVSSSGIVSHLPQLAQVPFQHPNLILQVGHQVALLLHHFRWRLADEARVLQLRHCRLEVLALLGQQLLQ